jgi:ribosome-associated protein
MEKQEIEIFTETITLGQFLKWSGLVETGQQAKNIIQGGEVKLNGTVETRRGKTLKPGDIVELEDISLVVIQGEQEV